MILRDALPADLPQIVEIANALLPTTTFEWTERPHTLEERAHWLEQQAERGDPVLVAERAGAVEGFAYYGDFRDSRKWPGYRFVVEHTVHVRERAWGGGVGRALMDALFERARAAGKRAMIGGIDGENVASLRFHERLGFVEVARMPGIGWKLERRLTLVLMQRDLA